MIRCYCTAVGQDPVVVIAPSRLHPIWKTVTAYVLHACTLDVRHGPIDVAGAAPAADVSRGTSAQQ